MTIRGKRRRSRQGSGIWFAWKSSMAHRRNVMAERRERGFAAMDPEEGRAMASRGGRAAHQRGTAHKWNEGEAADAGRKGGEKVSRDRQHMAEIGRKGGKAAHRETRRR